MRGVGRFGPLRERQFRLLWFARTGSAFGDSLIPVALIWAVSHDLGAGATGVGLLLACYWIGGAAVTLLLDGLIAGRSEQFAGLMVAERRSLALATFSPAWASTSWGASCLACSKSRNAAASSFFSTASWALTIKSWCSSRL